MSSVPNLILLIEEPNQKPESIRFEHPTILKIGRGKRKGIDIALDDPLVARVHVTIQIRDADSIFLIDMGSSDGTFVDGKSITTRYKLKHGSQFRIGNTQITMYLDFEAPIDASNEASEMLSPNTSFGTQLPPSSPFQTTSNPFLAPMQYMSIEDSTNPSVSVQVTSEVEEINIIESIELNPFGSSSFYQESPYQEEDFASETSLDSGKILHPLHKTHSFFYGVLTSTPAEFPVFTGHLSLETLLEVGERIQSQVWTKEEKIW